MDGLRKFILDLAKNIEEQNIAEKFGQLAMQAMEEQPYSSEDSLAEAVEQYREIIQLLSSEYTSVKLDPDDLLTITIDGKAYDLDDKTTPNLRKAAEHRMSIEALLSDFDTGHQQIIAQIEAQLNKK